MLVEPENKLVFLTTEGLVADIERKYLREGKMSVKYLDSELRTQSVAFSMRKFTIFFEEFKSKIQTLIETGQFKRISSGKNFKRLHENIDADVPPLVLNMDDLEIGFLACLVPLALSVVAFVCELAESRIRTIVFDHFTFLYWIRAVIEIRVGLS